MGKDFSPEERLLRLIRSKASAPDPAGPQQPEAGKPEPAEEVKREGPKARPQPESVNIPADRESPRNIKIFRWENLNLALIIILAGLLAYFMPLVLKKPKAVTGNVAEAIKGKEKPSAQKAPEEPARPPFTYYSEGLGARNIFSPVLKEEPANQPPGEQGPKLEDVKGQLNLLGVISGAPPQAIIEDKRTQKTYFLNKGATFDDIEVGDILDNKVILNYKGKQFELVL
jgi:hypothetical protein